MYRDLTDEWYKIPMFNEEKFSIVYKDNSEGQHWYYIFVSRVPMGWMVSKDSRTNPPCFIPYVSKDKIKEDIKHD